MSLLLKKSFQVSLVSDAGSNVGRGLVATQTIEEGEILFKIPLEYVMSSDSLRKHPVLGRVADKIPGEVMLHTTSFIIKILKSRWTGHGP
jgi:hypothetical protein